MTATKTTAPALVTDASAPAKVRTSTGEWVTVEAAWFTSDGYRVFRSTDGNGNPIFWVRELDGRDSRHNTLTAAARDIRWLRAHGR